MTQINKASKTAFGYWHFSWRRSGGYKMLIGDHFFSHTLVTMILAWLLINAIVLTGGLLDSLNKRLLMHKAGPDKRISSPSENVNEV